MLEILIAIGVAVLALIYSLILTKVIKKKPAGSKKMADVAGAIAEGARAYLNKQYTTLSAIAGIVFILLLYFIGLKTALGFLLGAVFSVLAGYIGMRTAVVANVRTAEAAKSGIFQALGVALKSGSVMSFMVVGLGLLASAGYYAIFKDTNALLGLAFGGSFVAFMMRTGGGIFAKTADLELGLKDTDSPGTGEGDIETIIDSAGDNINDIGGTGVAQYESLQDSLIVAMILGAGLFANNTGIYLPLIIVGIGVAASAIGSFLALSIKRNPNFSLNLGAAITDVLMLVASFFLARYYARDLSVFYAVAVGLAGSAVIGLVANFFTSQKSKEVNYLANLTRKGTSINIIGGVALGAKATAVFIIILAAMIFTSYWFLGAFGVALAAVGALSTLGVSLAYSTFGGVADSAVGIGKVSDANENLQGTLGELNSLGNLYSIVGKSFSAYFATLTSVILFLVYGQVADIPALALTDPKIIAGFLLGVLLPLLIAEIILRSISGAVLNYKSEVKILARIAEREVFLPLLLAVLSPLLIGIFIGNEALASFLAGSIACGSILAFIFTLAGGAWDNTKRNVEKEKNVLEAARVGDLVGDPLKDAVGPTLNVFMKFITLTAILVIPITASDITVTVKVILAVISILGVSALSIFKPKTNE